MEFSHKYFFVFEKNKKKDNHDRVFWLSDDFLSYNNQPGP